MTLEQYVLTGLCTGAGMPVFGALAITFWRLPDSIATYHIWRLCVPASFLCLACAILAAFYLANYSTMPRALFVGCVAGGAAIGILAIALYRWWRSTSEELR
jgi:hypothetical protein